MASEHKKTGTNYDDVLNGKYGGFVQTEHDDPPNAFEIADTVEKPELRVNITGQFYRQTTPEECAALCLLLDMSLPTIEQAIMTKMDDKDIRTAVIAMQSLLKFKGRDHE